MHFIQPQRWLRQPSGHQRLDWTHPLARDLLFYIDYRYGPVLNPAVAWIAKRGLPNPSITVTGGAPVTGVGKSGRGVKFNGSSDVLTYDPYVGSADKSSVDSAAISVLAVARRDGAGTGEEGIVFRDNVFRFTANSAGDQKIRALMFPGANNVYSAKAIENGRDFAGIIVGSASETTAYLDGSVNTTTGGAPNTGQLTNVTVGSDFGKFNGLVYFVGYWTRALSRAEGVELSLYPWQLLFSKTDRRIYLPAAGGGAVSGTISESGTLASSFASTLLAKGTISESATLASSVSGKTIYPVSLEEVATLASTFSGGVLYSVSVEESGTLADSVTSIITINRTLSESATLDSGFTSSVVFSSTITEAATLASPLQGLGNFLGTFSESGTLDYSLTSSVESAGAYSGTILEAATLASSFASVLIAKSTLAESATLADSYVSSWSGSVTYVESDTLAFTVSANTGAPSGGSTGGGGGIRAIPLGQDYTMMVKMVDIDGTGVAGLTLSFTASKAGGVFNSLSPSVVDRGSGWYAVTIDATDLDTEGEFVLTVEGTGAETQAVISQVALSTQDAVTAALTAARLLTLGQFLALK